MYRTYLALGIACLWAVGYMVSIVTGTTGGVTVATPVMLIAAAYLLGQNVRRNGNGRSQ